MFACVNKLLNMLFNEILKEKFDTLSPLFNALFDLAIKNQTHSGDLLLVMEHALLAEERDLDDPEKQKLYYNIGTGMDYHCETASHDFIRQYIRSVIDMSYTDYKALHRYSAERSEEIDEIVFEESNTIQTEMLIYLKIWEGEAFLKKMYQVSRLINGMDYDWHLMIGFGGQRTSGIMERFEVIRALKENLKEKAPGLFNVVKRTHWSQLRNAIAHSQYAMLGRHIVLNNYVHGKVEHKLGLDFDEWVDVFHETLTIFTLYEMFFNRVREYYYELTLPHNLKKEIRVQRRFPEERSFLLVLHSNEHLKDWSPYPGR
jgi:hypothetical protein